VSPTFHGRDSQREALAEAASRRLRASRFIIPGGSGPLQSRQGSIKPQRFKSNFCVLISRDVSSFMK
jgi:hypothetical protein